MRTGRDVWWENAKPLVDTDCPVEWMNAEDGLFILYTSGSTGRPKGMFHTTGGYMVYTATTAKFTFDLKPDDVYWCTADIGWITGKYSFAFDKCVFLDIGLILTITTGVVCRPFQLSEYVPGPQSIAYIH